MTAYRIMWDGGTLHCVPTLTIKEIDGVIARLERAKEFLREAETGLMKPTTINKIIIP